MILNVAAARHMAQEKANQDMRPISLYQRKSGEFIIGRDILLIKQMLGAQEQITYLETIQPQIKTE